MNQSGSPQYTLRLGVPGQPASELHPGPAQWARSARCRDSDGVNQSCGALVESGAPVQIGDLADSDGVNQSCRVNQSGPPTS
jgi:hypothetical protein